MKKQVLVDMDGVLADVYSQLIRFEYKNTGILQRIEEYEGKPEDTFPSFYRHVTTPGFFRTAPLMPDSVEGLRFLNERCRVLVVSSATEFPQSLVEKQAWLNEHFPFIGWRQMIFCGSKDSVRGDIMIDDHPKNLCHFQGQRIMFAQPHNLLLRVENSVRVSGWKEILSLDWTETSEKLTERLKTGA